MKEYGHGVSKSSIDYVQIKSNVLYLNKYIIPKQKYVDSQTKIEIICPTHGSFLKRPNDHLRGQGCPICSEINIGISRRLTLEEVQKRSNEIHDNNYVIQPNQPFVGCRTKIKIICKKHGEFTQTANKHIHGEQGCPSCGLIKLSENSRQSLDEIRERSNKIHLNKYVIQDQEYKKITDKIKIVCPIHGEFIQDANSHVNLKCGCPKCSGNTKLTLEQIQKRSNEIHNNKYSVDMEQKYKDSSTKIKFLCPIHGEFLQTPHLHLRGYGCKKCTSSRMENTVRQHLMKNNIKFEEQKRFNFIRNKNPLPFDFYLIDYNCVIECQGKQHFGPTGFGCKDKNKIMESYNNVKNNDLIKFNKCKELNIKLLYLINSDLPTNDQVYTNQNTFSDINILIDNIYEHEPNG